MSKVFNIFRWITVVPGSILCALLIRIPVYIFANMAHNGSFLFSLVPIEKLVYFGLDFMTPFIIIVSATYIAPKFKQQMSIIATTLTGVFGIAVLVISIVSLGNPSFLPDLAAEM